MNAAQVDRALLENVIHSFMGQYYKPVNIDRREWVDSHDYDSGLKLMEHSYVGNRFVTAVEFLLATSWKGGRIVWAGDYADPETQGGDNLHGLMGPAGRVAPAGISDRSGPLYRYILNHDRRTFVDIAWAPVDAHGFRIHPLPLLTVDGNGRGGGDYHSTDARLGMWARQRLEVTDDVPDGYVEQDGRFIE